MANAGHQPALLHYPSGEFRQFPATAPPLGVLPDSEFPVTGFRLDGGSLYLFSDGVTESLVSEGRALDVGGLMRLIRSSAKESSRIRLQNIVAKIRRGDARQRDDITMMLIERLADRTAGGARARPV